MKFIKINVLISQDGPKKPELHLHRLGSIHSPFLQSAQIGIHRDSTLAYPSVFGDLIE